MFGKGRIHMYENNYNYINVPDDDNKPKSENKVGKSIAMLLAVAIVGGASGFGGAYLQNSLAAEDQPAASVSSENASVPQISDNSSKNENIISCVLLRYTL